MQRMLTAIAESCTRILDAQSAACGQAQTVSHEWAARIGRAGPYCPATATRINEHCAMTLLFNGHAMGPIFKELPRRAVRTICNERQRFEATAKPSYCTSAALTTCSPRQTSSTRSRPQIAQGMLS